MTDVIAATPTSAPRLSRSLPTAGDLDRQIRGLLRGCMGAYPPFPSISRIQNFVSPKVREQYEATVSQHLIFAIGAGLLFAILFYLIPLAAHSWMTGRIPVATDPEGRLLRLAVYGSLWFGWATLTSRLATSSMLRMVNSILPKLPPDTISKIARDIKKSHFLRHASGWSCFIALWLVVPTALELRSLYPETALLLWWSVEWWLMFYVASRGIIVGCFYYLFPKHIFRDHEKLFWPDPANTTLVKDVSSLGRMMMLFWVGIALSIVFVIPFVPSNPKSVVTRESYTGAFEWGSLFMGGLDPIEITYLFLIMPATEFGALLPGTIVFLRSEAAIGRAVSRSIEASMALLEKASPLLEPDVDWRAIHSIEQLHHHLANGHYRSYAIRSFSILLPAIGPALALARFLLKQ
jgi:hypothetical protein